jgi:hypothetical protein
MKSCFYILLGALIISGCNNIEDATPSDNNTFIKFFHGPYNYEGVEVEILPDGYALLGTMKVADDSTVSFLVHTDKRGNQVGDISYFHGTTAKAFEVIYAGEAVSGYLILGDSIKIDPGADKVGNIEIYSTRILKVDNNGNIVKKISYTDNSADTSRVKIDYKGNSLKINQDGDLIVLGTYREDLSKPEKSFIVSLSTDLAFNWFKEYDLLDAGQVDYNYVNSKSVHIRGNNIVWASAILKPTQGFNDSYLAVPYVESESVFNNFSQMGENSSQLFLARDIQPSPVGYGIVGTRGLTDGTGTNMFFVRVDVQGNFIANSDRYFDGALSKTNVSVEAGNSENLDQGDALTTTDDGGYVLAGSTKSGNDARDIYLVKVNALGEIIWNRVLGGEGDETVGSIREEADGSLVLSGTNDLSGLSSLFLIKLDKNGELIK